MFIVIFVTSGLIETNFAIFVIRANQESEPFLSRTPINNSLYLFLNPISPTYFLERNNNEKTKRSRCEGIFFEIESSN